MKSDKQLKKEEERIEHEDRIQKMRKKLDRTHLSSSSRKTLEKAFKKLATQAPPPIEETEEDFDE